TELGGLDDHARRQSRTLAVRRTAHTATRERRSRHLRRLLLNDVATGSAGFARALLYSVPLALGSPVEVPSGSSVNLRVAARRTCAGVGHAAGTVRLCYNGAPIDTGACRDAGTRFTAAIGGLVDSYYLRPNSQLDTAAGSSMTFVERLLSSST